MADFDEKGISLLKYFLSRFPNYVTIFRFSAARRKGISAQNFTQIKIEENDFYGIFEQSTKSLDSVLEEFFFIFHIVCASRTSRERQQAIL